MTRFSTILLVLDSWMLVAGVMSNAASTEKEVRLVLAHLRNQLLDTAVLEFKNLKNCNDVVVEIVRQAFADDSIKLEDLAAFTTRTGYFDSGYLAIDALFVEMQKGEKLREISILSIFFELQRKIQIQNFVSQSKSLQENIKALLAKMEPHADAILKSLVADISRGHFAQPLTALEVTRKAIIELNYLSDIVKRSLATRSETVFENLYAFIVECSYVKEKCTALSSAWEKLREQDRGDGFEALQIWLYAKSQLEYSQFIQSHSSWEKCEGIGVSAAPAYRATLMHLYLENIVNRNPAQIISWHKKYDFGMRVLLRDVISSMSRRQMHFDDLLYFVDNLPFLRDDCWALEAVRNKLESFGMLGSFEHFRTLFWLKKTMAHPHFKNVDPFNKDKCKKAKEGTPETFQKLLYTDISNIRLLNHKYDEPLYCASGWNDWRIFTWVSKQSDEDQFWNIEVTSNGKISFRNNHRELYMCAKRCNSASCNRYLAGCFTQDTFSVEDYDGYLIIKKSYGEILSAIGPSETRRFTDFIPKDDDYQPSSNDLWYML